MGSRGLTYWRDVTGLNEAEHLVPMNSEKLRGLADRAGFRLFDGGGFRVHGTHYGADYPLVQLHHLSVCRFSCSICCTRPFSGVRCQLFDE